jgi:hypothetical protein
VEDLLGAAEREDDPMRRKAAIAPLVAMLDRVQRGLAAVGTPAEPGATWRPERPPLTPAQKDERLAEVRTDTRHAARSMTDAVRRVIAARRQRAVPLYATFSNEMRAAYAIAATDFALGLTPAAPYQPGTTTRTAPWGVFKVRSTAPPAEAPQRFAASPPLPARGELLEARLTRVQLLRLHAPARAPGAADSTEADHAIS